MQNSIKYPHFLTDSVHLSNICHKVYNNERITCKDAFTLHKSAPLGLLSILSEHIALKKNGNNVFYIQNFHIEPSNVCIYNCLFCSYSCKINDTKAWDLTIDDYKNRISEAGSNTKEVHITGGAYPGRFVEYYGNILKTIKEIRSDIHIKAFSAVEIHYMSEVSKQSYKEILSYLVSCGLGSIPGGGAEIFNTEIRNKICPDKANTQQWLEIHETAHNMGLKSNATMLYGHIENFNHRIEHMEMLRNLQDKTNGFMSFIPLKFKKANNNMSGLSEVSIIEDMRNYAISRIFLDNFPHIKAYWPMLGVENAILSLSFGVSDFDGTINDSTKIYSSAGGNIKPTLTKAEIISHIHSAGKTPIERDSFYQPLKTD